MNFDVKALEFYLVHTYVENFDSWETKELLGICRAE